MLRAVLDRRSPEADQEGRMTKLYGTPGPRAIYPETAKSPSLAACSLAAQLLFDRIVAACDDQGRMQAIPALVKAEAMPLIAEATMETIAAWLDELERTGHIRRYETDGYQLLQVVTWWKHQGGMRWAYPSRWAAQDGWDDVIRVPSKKTDTPVPVASAPAAFRGNLPQHSPSREAQATATATATATAEGGPGGESAEDPQVSEALTWLARHGCLYLSPGSRLYVELESLLRDYGANRVIGLWDRIAEQGIRGDAGRFIFGAKDALIPRPNLRALAEEDREAEEERARARRVETNERRLAEYRRMTAQPGGIA